MENWRNKLDAPLRRFLEGEDLTEPVYVVVQHIGDLAELVAAGLQDSGALGSTMAAGTIGPDAIAALAGLAQVVSVRYGMEHDPDLETSVPEIRADQVWTLNRATGAFSGGGETGEGVVIGIIDSGIDVTHPDFFNPGPPPRTRIMRVWDQGLTPIGGEHSPATALLRPGAGSTYGVEISNTEIDAELAGGAEVRHADCNGHGTHVASIAAGSGLGAGRPHRNVGVAPKAQIVMVKIFSQVEEIGPSFTIRFFDAVHYILNVARTQLGDLPVVINYSGGSSIGPHDGLGDDDIFLTELFRGATKKIFVTSAGNSAGAKTHARITIPAGGEIDVPIDAFDTRRLKVDSTRCSFKSNTRAFLADFWYPDVAGVSVRLKTPVDPDFRATAVAREGPTFSATFDGGKQFELSHASQSSIRPAEPGLVPSLDAVTVTRSRVFLAVGADGDDHAAGRYELKFSGPAGTVIEGWVSKSGPQGMRFVDPPPAGVVIRNVNDTVSSPAGARHVLTVGAYADEAVTIGGIAHAPGDIAFFSSRGVLIDYAGIGNPPEKPDLSGPGVEITAANSSTTTDPVFRNLYDIIDHYTKKSGTSMSAPHVAGTVALMMEKKSDLTVDEARTILTTAGQGVRATPPPKDYGVGKLDAKGAVDNTP